MPRWQVEELRLLFTCCSHGTDSPFQEKDLSPFPDVIHAQLVSSTQRDEWVSLGKQALVRGEVAILSLSGGRASRMGSGNPKALLDLDLPSKKKLMQIHLERLSTLKTTLREEFGIKCPIPFFAMTNKDIDGSIKEYFVEHEYFGHPKEDVIFFMQDDIPCLDEAGNPLTSEDGQVVTSPNGHGGFFSALKEQPSLLAEFETRGIKSVFVFSVDNVLSVMADAEYIGCCIALQTEMGFKTVPRLYPDEPAGVVCLHKSLPEYVEYSELPKGCAELRKPDGTLAFDCANILNLFFSFDFLKKYSLTIPPKYHVVKREIPDPRSQQPRVCLKYERFALDATRHAGKVTVYMCARDGHFSPIKYGWDRRKDSLVSARRDLTQCCVRLLASAGIHVVGADDGSLGLGNYVVEVSPLVQASTLRGLSGLHVYPPVYFSARLNSCSDGELRAVVKALSEELPHQERMERQQKLLGS